MKRFLKFCTASVLVAGLLLATACGGGIPKGLTQEPTVSQAPVSGETPSVTDSAKETPAPLTSTLLAAAPAVTTSAVNDGVTVRAALHYITDDGYVQPVLARLPVEEGIAKACLMRLVSNDENVRTLGTLGLSAPIPAGTDIRLAIASGEARLELVNMPTLESAEREQKLLVSLVNTLVQFPTIDCVSITVNGNSEKMPNGTTLPKKQGRYALNPEGEVTTSGSARALTLYFPNRSGSMLVPVTRYVGSGGGVYQTVAELAKGTSLSGLRSLFPENTLILGAAIENGILTVNCTKELEAVAQTPGLFGLLTSALLLSAANHGSIDEIVLTVNGRPFDPNK